MLELSLDGGTTFQPVSGTTPEILRVVARSQSNLQYIGADQNCEAALYQSVDGGTSWSKGPSQGSWHLATGGNGVVSPNGPVDVGCEPLSLSVLGKDAALVGCVGGAVHATSNGGAQWAVRGTLDGLVSISFLDENTGYALAPGDQCPAEVLRTTDGGASWTPVGCVNGSTPQALDAVGQRIFATVDGAGHVSTDGGGTWS